MENSKEIKKTIISDEMTPFHQKCKKIYELIGSQKGIIVVKGPKNNPNDLKIELNNNSFLKIIDQASLNDRLISFIINTIINQTTLEIDSSTKIITDNNEKFVEVLENKNEFQVTLAKDMELSSEEKAKRQIHMKNKSIKNIMTKMGGVYSDNLTLIQLLLTQVSYDYDSTRILTQYIVNRYHFLMDSRKTFYISYNTKKDEKEGQPNEEEEVENYPVSYYSIKKVLGMVENDQNQKEKFLNLTLQDEDTQKYEQENNLYIKKLRNSGMNNEIYNEFKKNKVKNVKNILDKKVEIQRMKKVGNKEANLIFNNCDGILNEKRNKEIQIIQLKKKEVEDALNNRKNKFIEIMHNVKDKRYINLQYLDLMEDFVKKNSKYKIDFYTVKNHKFKDIDIPADYIKNYLRYKAEYEKRQFVLLHLNPDNKKEGNYLVSVNDLQKLYDQWTILEKEEEINTENPQFEGKRINLQKAKIIRIDKVDELPEQPDLIKKVKEEEEKEKEKEKAIINQKKENEKNLRNFPHRKHPEVYENLKDRKYITIRRRIIRKKKNAKKQ